MVQCRLGDRQAELVDVRAVNDRTAVTRYHGHTVAIMALRPLKAHDCTLIATSGFRVALRHMQDVQSSPHPVEPRFEQ